MTNWKGKLDSKSLTLIKRAAKCQLDLGMGEMIVNRNNINDHRNRLSQNGSRGNRKPKQFKSLEEHYQAIKDCQKCPLYKTRTNLVYGVGDPDADVMFIGEAPGRDEDLKGEPFVGRAGQLLDKILAAINFSRQEVYIANILKSRPPNNRDPQPDEMEACLPYLMEQIRLIRPKIICALGRISAQALLQTTTPLGKLRKQWHDFHGIPFIVTYHPAALLRFKQYKKDVWEDIQMLRKKYDELIAEKADG